MEHLDMTGLCQIFHFNNRDSYDIFLSGQQGAKT